MKKNMNNMIKDISIKTKKIYKDMSVKVRLKCLLIP